MPKSIEELNELTAQVTQSPKYAQLADSLINRVSAEELERQPSLSTAVKSTRTRLHQLTTAFLPTNINYALWLELFNSNQLLSEQASRDLAMRMMRLHASTAERLPVLEFFYRTSLASIAPLHSVVDLACGLNPLAIPWMPLADDFTYFACDVVKPLVDFLQKFFNLRGIHGEAEICDLSQSFPAQRADLTLLLKTLPLLTQMEKGLAEKVLAEIQSPHILISYPLKSLGGRAKGMQATYQASFEQLIAGKNFSVRKFEFSNEIAYLLSR